jgi:hypothetical protein
MLGSVLRATTMGAMAMALILGVSGCGGNDVDKADLVTKVKSEPDIKDAPSHAADDVVDCIADVALKYGDKGDLKRYVNGEIKLEAVKGLGPNDKEADAAAEKCVQDAIKYKS